MERHLDTGRVETYQHIQRVQELLNTSAFTLIKRGEVHDASKLASPEVEGFTEHGPKLKELTFDSEEYKESLKALDTAREHHYAKNRHHPEHFKNGIEDMNLFDVLEMFCDWKAASERQHDGNIRKSIDVCADRFGISPQLVKILENTADVIS